MADIELIDIFIVIIPILMFNIIFSLRNSKPFKLSKSKFPLLLISYSFLVTISIFVFLVIVHIHFIHNTIVFHIHNFHSDVINDISTFEIDFIAMLVVGWCLSILYSALLISQFAMRLLNNYLSKSEILYKDPFENLPKETIELLNKKNIQVKVISNSEMGLIFSLSFISLLKRKNFIFIHRSIFDIFTVEEYNAALIHEMGHIYNMDTIFFPVFNTMSKLMFFDPFLRKLNHRYRNWMEEKADTFALLNIRNKKDLARAIVKSIDTISTENTMQCESINCNSSILSLKSSDKTTLTTRIKKIINFEER